MNALLQNPYMAIHPPTLFVGYTMLSIPYAYSIAALCFGDVTEGWLKSTRRWALKAWMALSAGIWLGGRWAYVELDGLATGHGIQSKTQVSFLVAVDSLTAFSFSSEKLGHLKRLSILLSVSPFYEFFWNVSYKIGRDFVRS